MTRGSLHPRSAAMCMVVAALAMGSTPSASAQEIMASLGSPALAVDTGATTAPYTQSASGLVFNGTYALADTLGGTFTEQDWSKRSGFGVFMTLTGTNPSLPFSIQFFDTDFNVINTYEGNTEPLVDGTPTFVPLALNLPGTGVLSRVAGIQFTWDGGGAVNVILSAIAATPTPTPTPTPSITSAASASGRVGTPFSYRITANNSPTSYGAALLPSGLTIDTTTGVISGTPITAGTSTVNLSALNASGTGTAALKLTINKAPQIITFKPAAVQRFKKGRKFTLAATASPSRLAVSFRSSNSKILSISGRTATIRAIGKVTVTATQGGNAKYLAAKPVPRTITIK